jgi:hypothetical protein
MHKVVAQALTLCKHLVAAPEFVPSPKATAAAAGKRLVARPAFVG